MRSELSFTAGGVIILLIKIAVLVGIYFGVLYFCKYMEISVPPIIEKVWAVVCFLIGLYWIVVFIGVA